MYITASQFNALDSVTQMQLLLESATIVGSREEGDLQYTLFNIDGLYVEHCCNSGDARHCCFTCVENTDDLLPYTEEIAIVFL